MKKNLIKKAAVTDLFTFFHSDITEKIVKILDYEHINALPSKEFWTNFREFVKVKNKLEEGSSVQDLMKLGEHFSVTALLSIGFEKNEYAEMRNFLPKSNFHYECYKDVYSLTSYYLLRLFRGKAEYISLDYQASNENFNKAFENKAETFKEIYTVLNEHMHVVEEMATLENVNIDNIFKFINNKGLNSYQKNLIITDRYWDFLKKEENKFELLTVWEILANHPLERHLHLNQISDSDNDVVIQWMMNLPISILQNSIKHKGFVETFSKIGDKKMDGVYWFSLYNDVLDIKERQQRESDLKETLSKVESKEKDKRNKRKL